MNSDDFRRLPTGGNPWKRLSTREVFRNAWLTLREDGVIRPDGEEATYTVVDTRVATATIALTPDNHVYLIGQYRYPTDMYSWELVEGGADEGEDPLEAAQRELEEEAGLIAGRWTPLGGEVHLSNCISSEAGYFYLAQQLTVTKRQPDATEILEVNIRPFEECLRMVDSGEIVDAMSIIGLLKLERYLKDSG